ncbi:MAG: capsule assembly Wzi family protein [Clostridia bacterium]|nr:capsule assembly Wzi family protein [Clostridia bacterium]
MVKKTTACIIMYIFCISLAVPATAELFSETNRYLLNVNATDTSYNSFVLKFHSLPSLYVNDSLPSAFRITFGEERIGLGAKGIIAAEANPDSITPYGCFVGKAQFASPYLDAKVRLNWYTLKQVSHTEPTDVEFERFYSGKVTAISGMFDNDFTLPEAFLTFKYRILNLSIGKEKVRWGPGYKGTLALSGTALTPFYYYHLKLNLMSRVHLSCFLAGYDDDRFYKNEFTGFDTIKSKTGKTSIASLPSRYGVGQRIDIRINDHVQFGIHELCGFYGSNDLTRYANPLQVYYLGYNSGTNEANMMAGCDVNLLFKPFRFYGEFLDDDITIFDDKGNPNKYAFQLGGVYYRNKIIREIGFEYTHVSKYTYGHYSILNRHEYWGEPLAWPWGNDQDVFTLHVQMNPCDNISLLLEADYWIKGKGDLKDEWLVDGRPDLDHAPYWPRSSQKTIECIATVEYQPFTWMSTVFTWKPSVQNKKMHNDLFGYIVLSVPKIY